MPSLPSKQKPFLLNRDKLREAFYYRHPPHHFVSGGLAQAALGCAQSTLNILLYPYLTPKRREHAKTCGICTARKCRPGLPQHRRALSDISFETEEPGATIVPAILRLPYELRHAIFASLVGDDETPRHFCQLLAGGLPGTPKLPAVIALLQTCRQIYNECMRLLYATNLFDFNQEMMYLTFTKSVRAPRLAMIRHLQFSRENTYNPYRVPEAVHALPREINEWEAMWTTVGKDMEGLRRLKIRLYYEPYERGVLMMTPRTYVEDMLRSVRINVRGLERFSLEVATPAFDITELESEIRREVCSERVPV